MKSNTSEKVSELVEESNQQRQDIQHLLRNEKIRLVMIGVALPALLVGFLLYLLTGTTLPLFGTMVVAYLGYRRIDAWLDRLN